MSDDELEEQLDMIGQRVTETHRMVAGINSFVNGAAAGVAIAIVLLVLSLVFGCAPAPEAECKRDILGVEWGGERWTYTAPITELRCIGDEPPELVGPLQSQCLCFEIPCGCDGRTTWRCPVLLANTEFNK